MKTDRAQADDRAALKTHLEQLAESNIDLCPAIYARFFELCPHAEPLFGQFSQANKEHMINETFVAVLHWLDDEPWLNSSLTAMGLRHQFSYEIPTDLYAPFADAMMDVLEEASGDSWTPELSTSWQEALSSINDKMTSAYFDT